MPRYRSCGDRFRGRRIAAHREDRERQTEQSRRRQETESHTHAFISTCFLILFLFCENGWILTERNSNPCTGINSVFYFKKKLMDHGGVSLDLCVKCSGDASGVYKQTQDRMTVWMRCEKLNMSRTLKHPEWTKSFSKSLKKPKSRLNLSMC